MNGSSCSKSIEIKKYSGELCGAQRLDDENGERFGSDVRNEFWRSWSPLKLSLSDSYGTSNYLRLKKEVMQNWLKPLLAVPIGITIVDVLGYVARVDGESMKPTLNPNLYDSEYVFLNKVRNRKEISCKHGDNLHASSHQIAVQSQRVFSSAGRDCLSD